MVRSSQAGLEPGEAKGLRGILRGAQALRGRFLPVVRGRARVPVLPAFPQFVADFPRCKTRKPC